MNTNIVVNDTNIFIDLYSVDLLKDIFSLPYKFHTTDFVLEEITNTEQKQHIQQYINNGLLTIKSFSSKELEQVISFHSQQTNNMSIPDCSVCVYAKTNNYRLLTGDKNTRIVAQNNNIIVNGILFLFKELVNNKIISSQIAIQKLECLKNKNKRLPLKEIERLIELWNIE